MAGNSRIRCLSLAGAGLSLLLATTAVQADGASAAFADANRLFRDDLYWAALLRYREAAEAGMDTALLHYNTGIAHYHARQYVRARTELERARSEPALARRVQYALALTDYADGDLADARGEFQSVVDGGDSTALGKLAARAIARIDAMTPVVGVEATDTPAATADVRAGLALRLMLGAGSDDNVYRAPAESYLDLAAPGAPAVASVVQSGVYYPLRLQARYSVQSFENESFFGSYQLNGRYYQDPALDNATEAAHQLAFGTEYDRRTENRERRIYSAFTIARHDDVWFDPDDGSERELDGESLGERLSYTRYGPELWLRQSFSRLSFTFFGKGQIWNYDNTEAVPEYDHEFLSAGLTAQYRFTSTSLLRIRGAASSRRFGERPSYSLDGTQPIANPPVEYDYLDYGATARQRITRFFWFGLHYLRTERTDRYLGYNDFYRDRYGVELQLAGGERFRLRVSADYDIYGFVNAHAYNDPGSGRKTLEVAQASLRGDWKISRHFSLTGQLAFRDVTANDARIAYTRGQYQLGIVWQQ